MKLNMNRIVFALLAAAGCAPSDAGQSDTNPPQSCEAANDCFWSYCSFSSCADGKCVHEKIADGTTCIDPSAGYGECESSICVVPQRRER